MASTNVILIGGPPGVGKTTLCRSLAATLGFASLSGDDLAIACRTVTSRETHPSLHQMPNGSIEYFTESPPAQLITDAEAAGATMQPVVDRVIAMHARTGSPVVIDWWLLSPAHVSELEHDTVKSIWLHLNPGALEARERRNTDFFGDVGKPNQMLSNFMERSLWRNSLVAEQAQAHNLPLLKLNGTESPAQVTETALDLLGLPK